MTIHDIYESIAIGYNNLQLANEVLYSNWQSLTLAQQNMIQKHVNVLAVNCWSVWILSIIRREQTHDHIIMVYELIFTNPLRQVPVCVNLHKRSSCQ